MSHNLSEGAIETIMSGGEVKNPVVQVLGSKAIPGQANSERYRLLISDGKHLNSFAMLATQLTPLLKSGQLSEFSIVKITNHVVSMIKNAGKSDKRIMVILDVEIMVPGEQINQRIGNPMPLPDGKAENVSNGQSTTAATNTSQPPKPEYNHPAKRICMDSSIRMNNTVLNSPINKTRTHPIASLSPYQNGWVIKARVTNKSDVRTWSNARGEGKLFSLDLVDESGEIRATAFKEQCDKFFDLIEINKVYYISRGTLKMANKQYSTLNNDYELTFNSETKIAPCDDDDSSSIPRVQFHFKPLSALQDAAANTLMDAIGITKSASDVMTLTSRTTNRELKKREVTLVDQSYVSITLTLWGTSAEDFSADGSPVVAVKGARVGEYMNTKNLSLGAGTTFQINPDIPEAFKLRAWYDSLSPETQFTSISQGSEGSGGSANTLLIGEALANKLGCGDKADYFSTYATLMFLKPDRCVYKACPSADCMKKVVDQNNGLYRCEKCNKEFDSFKYRLMLTANIADFSGNQWVTLFQESGEELLGTSADEIGKLHDNEDPQLTAVFNKATLYPFNFKLRAKMDSYNDENRLKMNVISVKKPDMKERCKKLMSEIKEMAGIGKAH